MVPIGEACMAILGSGKIPVKSSRPPFFDPKKHHVRSMEIFCGFGPSGFGIQIEVTMPFTRGSQKSKPPGPQTTNSPRYSSGNYNISYQKASRWKKGSRFLLGKASWQVISWFSDGNVRSPTPQKKMKKCHLPPKQVRRCYVIITIMISWLVTSNQIAGKFARGKWPSGLLSLSSSLSISQLRSVDCLPCDFSGFWGSLPS